MFASSVPTFLSVVLCTLIGDNGRKAGERPGDSENNKPEQETERKMRNSKMIQEQEAQRAQEDAAFFKNTITKLLTLKDLRDKYLCEQALDNLLNLRTSFSRDKIKRVAKWSSGGDRIVHYTSEWDISTKRYGPVNICDSAPYKQLHAVKKWTDLARANGYNPEVRPPKAKKVSTQHRADKVHEIEEAIRITRNDQIEASRKNRELQRKNNAAHRISGGGINGAKKQPNKKKVADKAIKNSVKNTAQKTLAERDVKRDEQTERLYNAAQALKVQFESCKVYECSSKQETEYVYNLCDTLIATEHTREALSKTKRGLMYKYPNTFPRGNTGKCGWAAYCIATGRNSKQLDNKKFCEYAGKKPDATNFTASDIFAVAIAEVKNVALMWVAEGTDHPMITTYIPYPNDVCPLIVHSNVIGYFHKHGTTNDILNTYIGAGFADQILSQVGKEGSKYKDVQEALGSHWAVSPLGSFQFTDLGKKQKLTMKNEETIPVDTRDMRTIHQAQALNTPVVPIKLPVSATMETIKTDDVKNVWKVTKRLETYDYTVVHTQMTSTHDVFKNNILHTRLKEIWSLIAPTGTTFRVHCRCNTKYMTTRNHWRGEYEVEWQEFRLEKALSDAISKLTSEQESSITKLYDEELAARQKIAILRQNKPSPKIDVKGKNKIEDKSKPKWVPVDKDVAQSSPPQTVDTTKQSVPEVPVLSEKEWPKLGLSVKHAVATAVLQARFDEFVASNFEKGMVNQKLQLCKRGFKKLITDHQEKVAKQLFQDKLQVVEQAITSTHDNLENHRLLAYDTLTVQEAEKLNIAFSINGGSFMDNTAHMTFNPWTGSLGLPIIVMTANGMVYGQSAGSVGWVTWTEKANEHHHMSNPAGFAIHNFVNMPTNYILTHCFGMYQVWEKAPLGFGVLANVPQPIIHEMFPTNFTKIAIPAVQGTKYIALDGPGFHDLVIKLNGRDIHESVYKTAITTFLEGQTHLKLMASNNSSFHTDTISVLQERIYQELHTTYKSIKYLESYVPSFGAMRNTYYRRMVGTNVADKILLHAYPLAAMYICRNNLSRILFLGQYLQMYNLSTTMRFFALLCGCPIPSATISTVDSTHMMSLCMDALLTYAERRLVKPLFDFVMKKTCQVLNKALEALPTDKQLYDMCDKIPTETINMQSHYSELMYTDTLREPRHIDTVLNGGWLNRFVKHITRFGGCNSSTSGLMRAWREHTSRDHFAKYVRVFYRTELQYDNKANIIPVDVPVRVQTGANPHDCITNTTGPKFGWAPKEYQTTYDITWPTITDDLRKVPYVTIPAISTNENGTRFLRFKKYTWHWSQSDKLQKFKFACRICSIFWPKKYGITVYGTTWYEHFLVLLYQRAALIKYNYRTAARVWMSVLAVSSLWSLKQGLTPIIDGIKAKRRNYTILKRRYGVYAQIPSYSQVMGGSTNGFRLNKLSDITPHVEGIIGETESTRCLSVGPFPSDKFWHSYSNTSAAIGQTAIIRMGQNQNASRMNGPNEQMILAAANTRIMEIADNTRRNVRDTCLDTNRIHIIADQGEVIDYIVDDRGKMTELIVDPLFHSWYQHLEPAKARIVLREVKRQYSNGSIHDSVFHKKIRAKAFVKVEIAIRPMHKKVRPRMIQFLQPDLMIHLAPHAYHCYNELKHEMSDPRGGFVNTAGLTADDLADKMQAAVHHVQRAETMRIFDNMVMFMNGDDNICVVSKRMFESAPFFEMYSRFGRDPVIHKKGSIYLANYCSGGFFPWNKKDGSRGLRFVLRCMKQWAKFTHVILSTDLEQTLKNNGHDPVFREKFYDMVRIKLLSMYLNFSGCPLMEPMIVALYRHIVSMLNVGGQFALNQTLTRLQREARKLLRENNYDTIQKEIGYKVYSIQPSAEVYVRTDENDENMWTTLERVYATPRKDMIAMRDEYVELFTSNNGAPVTWNHPLFCHLLQCDLDAKTPGNGMPYGFGDEGDVYVIEADCGAYDATTQVHAHNQNVEFQTRAFGNTDFVKAIGWRKKITVEYTSKYQCGNWSLRYHMLSGWYDTSIGNGITNMTEMCCSLVASYVGQFTV